MTGHPSAPSSAYFPQEPDRPHPSPPSFPGYPTYPAPRQQVGPPPPFGAPSAGPYGAPAVPYPGPPYGYPPLPAPRRRGSWARRLVAAVAVLVVLSCLGATALTAIASARGVFDPTATWALPAGAPKISPAPADRASTKEWRTWAHSAMKDLAAAQSEALIKGDETAYLAPVDPANKSLVAEHRKRFRVLRGLGVGRWTASIGGVPTDDGYRTWRATITVGYCVGDASCKPVSLHMRSRWAYKGGTLRLVKLDESTVSDQGPRPWEVDDLQVKAGKRVVVAATSANAGRLASTVRAADDAAEIADQFAKWQPKPQRYVIFLAGPSNWKEWYGEEAPDWAAAWAVPVDDHTSEVVVRTDRVPSSEMEGLLTHELTHVTSLAGAKYSSSRQWWMVEGIADYAEFLDRPVSAYDGLPAIRDMVNDGWDGRVDVTPPTESSSLTDAAARYGIGFLAIRHIADKYGESKMMTFFGDVMHKGYSLDRAARDAIGMSWSSLNSECAAYIRSVV
ncbi:hypothetical protein [Luedemannella helvata]|uniref:Peptidase MA superfamily n=1 Tax=Luedemannella helvata TaxID=349315 RepID=A0ABP4WSK2_9ACTN